MNEEISKSQAKRDAEALKVLASQLSQLSSSQLDRVPLPAEVHDAVVQTKKMNTHLAHKRHIQYIAKLLRRLDDIDLIESAYQRLVSAADLNSPRFRLIESWRTRLITEDQAALTEFLKQYRCDQVQQLRQLIKKAKVAQEKQQQSSSSTALFRFLRDLIS